MHLQFSRLLQVSPALFAVTDRSGRYVDVRGAWEETLGWKPQELVGQHYSVVLHPDDVASTTADYEQNHEQPHAVAAYELRSKHRDGSFRWISWTSAPPSEGLMAAFGIDVTDRREELRQLRATRARMQSILETVPFYVTRTDVAGVIEYINRTYPGVTPEQVQGTHLLNWLPPEHRDTMQEAFNQALSGETAVERLLQGSGQHGVSWYRSRLGPIREGGDVVGVTVVGEDVTDSVLAEERHRQAARLEAVGQVAASIAHDLNNSLSVMLSEVDILALDLPSDPEVQASVSRMHRSIERMGGMMRTLIQAVRRDDRGVSPSNLVDQINQLQRMLEIAAGTGITLTYELETEAAWVELAAHELEQILVNLLVNSRQAGSGNVRISLDLYDVAVDIPHWLAPGRYARLRVKDDGPGISPEIRERVLDPFFTTKADGSGFGLPNCHAIARSRGGALHIDSPQGGGAEVSLFVPLLRGSDSGQFERPASVARGSASALESDHLAKPLNILLAEDDEENRTNLARFFTRSGHRVLEARNGADALDVMQRNPLRIDALLTDLAMPQRDGLWLVEQLANSHPTLPILVATGFVPADQEARLEALGAKILRKPVSPITLLETILALVAQATRD